DVSAVADPGTPVAIYDTAAATVPGISSGWNEAGGTSVATPIVAAAYALAGKPAAGTYPASYPYLNRAGFTDVTSGSNGNCEAGRRYLCRAGPGYDGPTGLGTPDGTGGFAAPASAVTVTDPGTQDMARGTRGGLRIAAVTTRGLAPWPFGRPDLRAACGSRNLHRDRDSDRLGHRIGIGDIHDRRRTEDRRSAPGYRPGKARGGRRVPRGRWRPGPRRCQGRDPPLRRRWPAGLAVCSGRGAGRRRLAEAARPLPGHCGDPPRRPREAAGG